MHRIQCMWVNNEQRDRIFEMIGTQTGTLHPAPGVRADHRLAAFLAVAAGIFAFWLVFFAL